ncbi:hypothetical protein MKQ70_05315 [Chitinophaga sedimenti]|uniref:glutamate racemase n=1 Tax=Chitinophaga sedimenti TaxID=2033606 RepID=UPI0020031D8C|nr:hypothetical protein [Chitinophaga sedimenti]MCK7554453.1 hypothetical protein [Chitinophaga sedimenti]
MIRPTTEVVGDYSRSRKVGVMGTAGTIASESYPIEIARFFPDITVLQQACPMWVPLVENNEWNDAGADYFIRKYIGQLLSREPAIDTIVLGCTHYPLLINKIKRYVPEGMTILSQGSIVADSLVDYLQRHPEIEGVCSRGGSRVFYTTDAPEGFDKQASIFFDAPVAAKHRHYNVAKPYIYLTNNRLYLCLAKLYKKR